MQTTAPLSPTSPVPHASRAAHSRFWQRLHRRYHDLFELLPPGPPTHATLQPCLASLLAKGYALGDALRILRQLVMERLIELDCHQRAPLDCITRAVTELAELALDRAHSHVQQELEARYGAPLTPEGNTAQLWIVGMGKFGARELNVSSDIDLIYVYESDGDTAGNREGRGKISNHEYFAKTVKAITQLIGETTEHGFVFRIDLALRPHGNSGPAATSLLSLENYLLAHGREWERFAWLKSRVVAPAAHISSPNVQALRSVVLPFVFRRYLDYNVFDALRNLHRQIREHAMRRSAGHPERANDVKISRGGIREIEFTVQLLQVVRGGQYPELRCRPTLEALQRLARANLMPTPTAEQLAHAYTFLRQVEHRIQYLDDQQTHILPTNDEDLDWIAHTMGHPDVRSFLLQLDEYRELVAQEFDTLLGGPSPTGQCANGQCSPASAANAATPELEGLIELLPPPMASHVAQWADNPKVRGLRDEARARLFRLVQSTGQWVQQKRCTPEAATRFLQWLEPLLRRESYLALLLERPSVHERLLHMLGAAKWPARYLQKHPGVIDELASDQLFQERFIADDFEREMALRLSSLQSTGEDDDENLLNLLRRAHHSETFRILARDIENAISVEQVADDLSALADSVLRVTSQWCWQRLRNRHQETPNFGIIGYGKLGGKELGYGSDLDIVFVFDDDNENAPEVYTAFVRKLINWLTVKTGEGDLFEIDTALRPNGSSGLLVTSFQAYSDYQQQRGSNTAWTWEHQAMTRARFVLGTPDLQARFDAVRHAVITAPRDHRALREEIVSMRQRVRQAHPVRGDFFDIKHSTGGMVDAEFAVQYLILAHAAQHPELVDNVGNIALLQRAEKAGLLPAVMGFAAANAYRELRRLQHRSRLDEDNGLMELAAAQPYRQAIQDLWDKIFPTVAEITP